MFQPGSSFVKGNFDKNLFNELKLQNWPHASQKTFHTEKQYFALFLFQIEEWLSITFG